MYKILFSILGPLALLFIAYMYGINRGVEKERQKWEIANVDTLVKNNENLENIIYKKDGEFFLTHSQDVNTGEEIETRTNKVTERILVPVETIVRVEVPVDCNIDDININYDTLRLFNSWSKGTNLEQKPDVTTTSNVPLVGSYPVQ